MGGGSLEGRGQFLVGTDCSQRHVQGYSIGIPLDVHDRSQGMVDTSPVLGRGAAVDGRADQGVTELDPGTNHQESLVHRGFDGCGREAQALCGQAKRLRIPLWVCRGDE